MNLRRGAHGPLGAGAGVAGGGAEDIHPVAWREAFHVRSEGFDFASGIGTRNVRECRLVARVGAGPNPYVDRVHADGADADEHL